MPKGMQGFQKGHKLSKGRPKKVKTQVKDWVKAHPYAVSELMQVLYDEGIGGDTESAIYIIDRIKGKRKQEVELTGGEQLGTGLVVELFKILTEKKKELDNPDIRLIEGGAVNTTE